VEVYPYSHEQEKDSHGPLVMYEKLGFERCGLYMDDCIIMRKKL
jgi:hypothetical protein